jgi:hypothetical protein
MGKRLWITENRSPIADIELITPESQIVYGFPGGTMAAIVSIGSALSNPSARIWDGHSETLERIKTPAFGNYVTEFYPSRKSVVSYIDGEEVVEPYREIIDESNFGQPPIFAPKEDQDALIIKVLRGNAGATTFIRIEGCGPAGTVHGFRMLVENTDILRELAYWASKWGSFEAVLVVEGVRVDIHGRKSMTATGPLHLVNCRPILAPEESFLVIAAAVKNSARLITKRESPVVYLGNYRKPWLDLNDRENYNPLDKNTATAVPLRRKEFLNREIDRVLSEEWKKLRRILKRNVQQLQAVPMMKKFRY